MRQRFLIVLASAWLAIVACAPPRAALTVANGPDLDTLDPQLARSSAALRAARALFAGLTRLDPASGEAQPDLATTWRAEAEGRRWIFTLRAGLHWSDGQPLTSADLIASWRRLQDPATAAPYAAWLKGATFAAPGPLQLSIRFPTPQPLFPLLCSHPALAPVPPALRAAPLGSLPTPLPTSGPFLLLERRLRDRLRLARNPQSWRAAEVQSETLDLLAIDSDITALNLFLYGEIAFAPKTPELALPTLRAQHDPRLHQAPELGTVFLRFNQAAPPFDDRELRQALLWGTDRRALAATLGDGRAPANSFVPPSMPGYHAVPWSGPQLERARIALEHVRQRHGGALPRLELLYPSTARDRVLVEALVAGWRRDLGIEVQLLNLEPRTFYPAQSELDYQMSLSSWVADYPDALSFLSIFHSEDPNNRSAFADRRYDELLTVAQGSLDEAERQGSFAALELRLEEQAVLVPLLEQQRQELVATSLRGWQDNAFGIIDWAALRWERTP